MREKDRDKLDDLFRSKLYDFEADTVPGDWEAISDRLPGRPSVPLHRRLSYWAAAAAVALLMITGGIYLYDRDTVPTPIAQEIQKQTENIENRIAEEITSPVADNQKEPVSLGINKQKQAIARTVSSPIDRQDEVVISENITVPQISEDTESGFVIKNIIPGKEEGNAEEPTITYHDNTLIADATPIVSTEKKTSSRKWGFGMGAGSFAVGSNSAVPQYLTQGSALRGESLMVMNSATVADKQEMPKTDIKHKTPVSFGLSINRYLNDRFALQTGISYTYLRSDWKTNGTYSGETKQGLHFIGLPLSLTYRIAEWNRFNFYAAAGGMTEVNVAGRRITRFTTPTEQIAKEKENIRMKEWLWSLNTSVGVSYPLIRFVSAFAEVGASYYFDNGSDIETIRSEKPFNVNLQFGLRLGF